MHGLFASLVPVTLFLVHASIFGGWLVDDAGISLAYAQNLAAGEGLVSQPGMPAVEAYSNPLWVLVLACGFWLTGASPLALSKFLSGALVVLSFVLYVRALADKLPNGRFVVSLGLCLVAVQTSVVVWAVSGLENPLTILLTAAIAAILLSPRLKSPGVACLAGCSTAALALTRPEGILYAWLYPVAVLRSLGGRTRPLVIYLVAALATGLPYLFFRISYFGELLPNPYYAKGAPGLDTVLALVFLQPGMLIRAAELSADLVGEALAVWTLLVAVAAISWALARRRWLWTHSVMSLITLTSLCAYLLLPSDWMPGHRYATPFFVTGTMLAVSLLFGGVFSIPSRGSPVLKGTIGVGLLLAFVLINAPRTLQLASAPTISVQEVAARARRLEGVSDVLGLRAPSWLTPDVGGALMYSSLRIFDLGMLCDNRIARYLGEGAPTRDEAGFHDYVFDEARPTFISTRAYHTWIARLYDDPRFAKDYVAIHEFRDAWIEDRFGITMLSGEYIKRGALEASNSTLEDARREWEKYPSPWDG